MATVVGNLQVDVTTGQATFTFDDAKKKLDDFGNSAQGASQKLDYSMREARESVTLTSDALGVHLPGGIARAIASIEPLGPALEAAMPVVAIIAAIALITAGIEKYRAALEKTKLDQSNFGSAIIENLRGLDDKFLQAGIKADELSNNHLAALAKELKLIDNQTLSDLEHEFESLGKVADTVFKDLESHWYAAGDGSNHAKYNLDQYEAKYRELLDTQGQGAANAYLQKQIEYEQHLYDLMNSQVETDATYNELKAAGTGYSEKEKQAQKELLDVLNSQVTATQRIVATANLEKHTDTAKVAEDAAKKKLALWEEQFKAAMKYRGAVEAANLAEEKRDSEADKKENESKQLDDWAKSLIKVREQMVSAAKAQTDLNTSAKTDSIDVQIAAYKRLASEGLLSESQLATKLKPLYQQETDAKLAALQAELQQAKDLEVFAQQQGDEEVANKAKADEIKLQAELLKIKKEAVTQQATLDQQMNADWQRMAMQMQTGFNNAVGKSIVEGKNFGVAMRQVAAQFLESMITSNLKWLENTILTNNARTASTAISGEEATNISLAQSLRLRFDSAKTAAAKAMTTVPFPLDLIVAPLVFAAALAFAEGGIVPGSGSGDTVPAMLTPGEAVLPQPMVQRLAEASGTGGDHYHLHYSPTNNLKAWDGSDVKDAMETHKNEFIKQVNKELRRRHK